MRPSKSLLTLRNKVDIGKISYYEKGEKKDRERKRRSVHVARMLRYVLLAPGDKLTERTLHGISA